MFWDQTSEDTLSAVNSLYIKGNFYIDQILVKNVIVIAHYSWLKTFHNWLVLTLLENRRLGKMKSSHLMTFLLNLRRFYVLVLPYPKHKPERKKLNRVLPCLHQQSN